MEKDLLPIQQQTLEFVHNERWQQLPKLTQRECEQSLSKLLKQVFATERTKGHEREDQ